MCLCSIIIMIKLPQTEACNKDSCSNYQSHDHSVLNYLIIVVKCNEIISDVGYVRVGK